MPQRLRFERVELLVEWYGPHNEGRVRAVLYRRPEDAGYAARLATVMGVPAHRDPGAPSQQAALPGVLGDVAAVAGMGPSGG